MIEKVYTLKHETTNEIVNIKAIDVDSETHKYNWCFWVIDKELKLLKAVYSQRYSIVNIETIKEDERAN